MIKKRGLTPIIPDIGTCIINKSIDFRYLWELRKTRRAHAFRTWLQNLVLEDADDLQKEYINLLRSRSFPNINNLPKRIIKFSTLEALSSILPSPASLALNATNSIFLDQLLQGTCPTLFIEDLRKLPPIS